MMNLSSGSCQHLNVSMFMETVCKMFKKIYLCPFDLDFEKCFGSGNLLIGVSCSTEK